jgi:putative ABC transport system permease protein
VVQVWVGNLLVPMELAGSIAFFPTLDPQERPFLVANLASVLQHVAIRDTRRAEPWVELWVQGGVGAASSEVWSQAISDRGGTVSDVHEATQLVAFRTEDPLLTAGWTGLLALSFLTAVLASSTGLLLYTYTEARERQGEFALLRSLGFSRLQVNSMVWFNLALVVAWGAAMGTLGGLWLGNALLPLLEVAEEGTRVTPPMVLQINWTSMATAYGVMAAAMAVTVGMLAWAISRLEVQSLLRMEAA